MAGLRAKQCAAIVLAVLSGDCPLREASRRLGRLADRYYGLERQALQGMVQALESVKERHRMAAESSPSGPAGTRSAAAASAGACDATRGRAAAAAEAQRPDAEAGAAGAQSDRATAPGDAGRDDDPARGVSDGPRTTDHRRRSDRTARKPACACGGACAIVLATIAGEPDDRAGVCGAGRRSHAVSQTALARARWRGSRGCGHGPVAGRGSSPLESPEVQQLQARIRELEDALKTTALRSEIALTMPYLLDRAGRKKKGAASRSRAEPIVTTRRSREQRVRRACVGVGPSRRWLDNGGRDRARPLDADAATVGGDTAGVDRSRPTDACDYTTGGRSDATGARA